MTFKDYLLALLTAILWGGNFIATKYGVDGFGFFGLSLMRVLLVAILFAPYLKYDKKNFANILKISMVYGAGFVNFFSIAIKITDNLPLIIILVQMTVPIGAILSYIYFKEKLLINHIVGMCVAFFGVITLVGVPDNISSLLSIISILIAASSQAWQMTLVRKYAKEIDIKNLLAWINLLNIPLFLLLVLIFEDFSIDFLRTKSLVDWAGALYVGIASTALGFGIWFALLKKYSVNKVSPFMLLVPFFGIILSIIFFDNPLPKNVIVGGVLIIAGVSIIQFWPRALNFR